MASLVYFSSASENTHRFIERLGIPATRIPLQNPAELRVDEPFVLVVPTYGGGSHVAHGERAHVPRQVIKFLNVASNRALMRGVIAAGNTNFGDSYCVAGDIISNKCQVPYLYRFEIMGTDDDIERVRAGLAMFWANQQENEEEQSWHHQPSATPKSA